jgi:hypothetical protein
VTNIFNNSETILWHVDPLLGNDREATLQQLLLSNGSTDKHVSMPTIALQQRNGVFCAFNAEML